MANDLSELREALAVQTRAQLQIVTMLQRHGELLAEIHQMVTPPEVHEDEPSLRSLLETVIEKLDQQDHLLESVVDALRLRGGSSLLQGEAQ